MSKCSHSKAAWSPGSSSSTESMVTALLPHHVPSEHEGGGDHGLFGLPLCGRDAVIQLHGKTLLQPLLMPSSWKASVKVHRSSTLNRSTAGPASSSHSMGIMGSSSIMFRSTDLLTLEEMWPFCFPPMRSLPHFLYGSIGELC